MALLCGCGYLRAFGIQWGVPHLLLLVEIGIIVLSFQQDMSCVMRSVLLNVQMFCLCVFPSSHAIRHVMHLHCVASQPDVYAYAAPILCNNIQCSRHRWGNVSTALPAFSFPKWHMNTALVPKTHHKLESASFVGNCRVFIPTESERKSFLASKNGTQHRAALRAKRLCRISLLAHGILCGILTSVFSNFIFVHEKRVNIIFSDPLNDNMDIGSIKTWGTTWMIIFSGIKENIMFSCSEIFRECFL